MSEHVATMKQPALLQSLMMSAMVALTVWVTVGAPPHQPTKTQFKVASRR
jgi:hypothetical protein